MLASTFFREPLVPTMADVLLKNHHRRGYATGNDIFSRAKRGFALRLFSYGATSTEMLPLLS